MENIFHTVKNDWTILPAGITWYLIGPPKSGKSTAASKWSEKGSDGVIMIDTDLGADFVEGANIIPVTSLIPPMRIRKDDKGNDITTTVDGQVVFDYEVVPPIERGICHRNGALKGKPMKAYSLVEAVDWIKENWDKYDFDCIVIDTIDKANEWIEEVVAEHFGVEEVSDVGFNKGYKRAMINNTNSIAKLQRFIRQKGATLILTSHTKPTTSIDGKVQLSPELPRGLASALTARADVIGYTSASKAGNFYVSFEAYDERTVGSRLSPLNKKKLPLDFETVANEIRSYKGD